MQPENIQLSSPPVTFGEKLEKLIGDRNRAEIARQSDLNPSVVNNYVNRGSEPLASAAFKLSKALGVSLDWLIDPDATFPAPDANADSLEGVSDSALMAEACRRLVNQAAKVTSIIQQIQGLPWSELADELVVIPLDAPLPDKFAPIMRWLYLVDSLYTMLGEFDASEKLDFYVSKPPSVRDLRDRVKELKAPDTDLSDAKKYRELRELSEAHRRNGIDPSAFDLEGFRRRLFEKRKLMTVPKKSTRVRNT